MYIVTGGAGFIGSAMIWRLNEAGIEDILVVDNLASSEKWRNLVNRRYRDYVHRDEFRRMVLEGRAPQKVEAIIHMGACSSTTERNADFLMDNNLHYSQMVCRYALEQGARLINASSAATYGDGSQGYSDDDAATPGLAPLNMYGMSKQLFDLWALRSGVLGRIAGLKYFNVYGPGEDHKGDMRSVIHKAHGQIRETGKVRLFKSYRPEYADGEQVRDFVYVKDAVDVTLFCGENEKASGLFNCGTGQARSWNDLAKAVFSAMGREPDIDYIEMPETLRDKYQYFTQAEMGKLRAAGYDRPFTKLEDGIREYVQGHLARN